MAPRRAWAPRPLLCGGRGRARKRKRKKSHKAAVVVALASITADGRR